MDRLHLDLFNAVKAACPYDAPLIAQKKANAIWKELKETKGKGVEFAGAVSDRIKELKKEQTRSRSTLLSYWINSSQSSCRTENPPPATPQPGGLDESSEPSTSRAPSRTSDGGVDSEPEPPDSPVRAEGSKRKSLRIVTSSDETQDNHAAKKTFQTPAQDKLVTKVNVLEKQLAAEIELRESGLAPPSIMKQIASTRKELTQVKRELERKRKNALASKKLRDNRARALKAIVVEKPDMAKVLRVRENVGRPLLEEDQPELFKAIVEIATFGGAADRRRQSDQIRSVKTLKDLHEALQDRGFVLSQSATYLRVLPRNSHTTEGQRHHVQSVPVKLCKAQADQRKDHPDGRFCTASIRAVEELVAILGSRQCIVLSQDDKSRVPLGITAANKQAPMVMHMSYRVRLPDHDFVVAPSHKLIPSVYAGVVIHDSKIGDIKSVSYSGPTYVAVRSGKHCSSTAHTHAHDFNRLLELDHFKDLIYENGKVKPILVIFSDGGPDECPRYPKVIAHAVDHFTQHDLDAVFLITNAPGRSAYNRVERRMSHLSRELAGVLLPHDRYGSHLKGAVTVNKDLELRNFQHAGETLAAIWSNLSIDGYEVSAEYLSPGSEVPMPTPESADWYATHVRESQYFLQIVKCDDVVCCGPWRSNLREVIHHGFLPPPFPLRRDEGGLRVPSPEEANEKDVFLGPLMRQGLGLQPFTTSGLPVPYDFYCPSVKDSLEGRTCPTCGLYFASAKSLEMHCRELKHDKPGKKNKRTGKVISRRPGEALCLLDLPEPEEEWLEDDEVTDFPSSDVVQDAAPDGPVVVDNLREWLTSSWTDDVDISQ